MNGEPRTRNFDLRSWQGLTEVLKTARESTMTKEAYGEFRDLVLQYAQQGGDQELRKRIDAIIATLKPRVDSSVTMNDTPALEQARNAASQAPGAQSAMGIRRPIPTFASRTLREATKNIPVPTPLASEVVPAEVPVPVPPPAEVAPSVPSASQPAETPIAAAVPIQETAPEPVIEAVAPQVENKIISETPIAAVPEQISIKSAAEYRDRIAEIKRTVLALVGNPITLVSAENHIGRAYMTALLNAMKATAPGSNVNVAEAMRTLEEAFATIEAHVATQHGAGHIEAATQAIETRVKGSPVVESAPQEEVTPSTSTVPSVEVNAEVNDLVNPRPIVESVSVDEPLLNVVSEPTETTAEPTIPLPENAPEVATEPPVPPTVPEEIAAVEIPESIPPQNPAAIEVVTPAQIPHVEQPVTVSEMSADVPSVMSEISWVEKETPAPLVADESSRELERTEDRSYIKAAVEEAKRASAARLNVDQSDYPLSNDLGSGIQRVPRGNVFTAVSADNALQLDADGPMSIPPELMTEEVTKAMDTLLNDWNLFASSGLFGMGPGGMDHPLFKKLSGPKMGDVIAGSFEGASIPLTHTIKDYVDAWRHEQGISYNPRESFEHYLRRVIQRILKRQNGEKIV